MNWEVNQRQPEESLEGTPTRRDSRVWLYLVLCVLMLLAVWLLWPRQVEAVAVDTATAIPSFTPTATSTPIHLHQPIYTPSPMPTKAPALIAWTPIGTCSFMRAAPQGLAEIVDCVPNGAQLTPEAEVEAQGIRWYRVRWEEATGWMAAVVLWDFQPTAHTVPQWTPMYGDEGTIVAWLPVHTPIVMQDERRGRLVSVRLPNGEQGWINEKNLTAP